MRKILFIIATAIFDLIILFVGFCFWALSNCGFNIQPKAGSCADKTWSHILFTATVIAVSIAVAGGCTMLMKRADRQQKSLRWLFWITFPVISVITAVVVLTLLI